MATMLMLVHGRDTWPSDLQHLRNWPALWVSVGSQTSGRWTYSNLT